VNLIVNLHGIEAREQSVRLKDVGWAEAVRGLGIAI